MPQMNGYGTFGDVVGHPATGIPAVYVYPEEKGVVEISLDFTGAGFMTYSLPPYNTKWRIFVDPAQPYFSFQAIYGHQELCAFLDYDGFRDGPFQDTDGWCVPREDFLSLDWHRSFLRELGYSERESEDATYWYGRKILAHRFSQAYFLVYPQTKDIVDQSVVMNVDPPPASTSRLWLYFRPSEEKVVLPEPKLSLPKRSGYHIVELGYLTDNEIPKGVETKCDGGRVLQGVRWPPDESASDD